MAIHMTAKTYLRFHDKITEFAREYDGLVDLKVGSEISLHSRLDLPVKAGTYKITDSSYEVGVTDNEDTVYLHYRAEFVK